MCLVLFDFVVYRCKTVSIYHPDIQCHPGEDGFHFESRLLPSFLAFIAKIPCVGDLNLFADFCKAIYCSKCCKKNSMK